MEANIKNGLDEYFQCFTSNSVYLYQQRGLYATQIIGQMIHESGFSSNFAMYAVEITSIYCES